MKVEDLRNYGKDILAIQAHSRLPVWKKLRLAGPAGVYAFHLLEALGLAGAIRAAGEVRRELARARQMDWSALKQRGISDENLETVLKKTVLSRVLAERLGLRRAAHLRHELSAKIAYPVLEDVFAAPEVFKEIGGGDFLPPFKQYYTALMQAMARAGLEEAEVVEDTPDTFQINITYCAWAEAARALGNPRYCYYATCYGDEVFFPLFCSRAGFRFSRYGTLGQGEPCCDHRFERIL